MLHANNENKCVSVFGDGLKEIKIELNDKWSIYANARAYKRTFEHIKTQSIPNFVYNQNQEKKKLK